MKFHGIDMRGKFIVQRVATIPIFESTDKGRLIYVEDEDEFYFGGTTEWKRGGGYHASQTATPNTIPVAGSDGKLADGWINLPDRLGATRTITIGNTGKSFDGSADVSWSLAEIGAARFGYLADGTDLNTVVNPGFYRLVGTHGNAPAGVSWGQLIVARGGGDTILQIVTGFDNGEIYWRQGSPPDVGGGGSWSAWYKFLHSGNLGDPATYAPPGMVAYFARSTAPSGWLKANGAAVSRTTYAALFAAIGTTFGAGDGSTTFNLPDLRGEFLRGWDDGRGVDSGRAFGTVQLDAMQGHGHANRSLRIGGTGGTGEFLGHNDRLVNEIRTGRITTPVSDGINGTPRTATETRPRNVALLACIKF